MATSPEDLRVLAAWLRTFRDLSQAEMAKRAKRSPGTISLYESGGIAPSPEAIERLAAAVGVPLWAAEGVLRPLASLLREVASAEVAAGADSGLAAAAEAALAGESVSPAVRLGIARFLAAPAGGSEEDPAMAAAEARGAAGDDPWRLLAAKELPPAAVALRAEFARLVEHICEECEHAAARDAGLALELGRLALRVAQLAPGDAAARARPRGYAQAFIGNALRAGDELRAADAAFADAWWLWTVGGAVPDSVLGEWRLLDLEASLRRDQRLFPAALELLDRALAAAPGEARGRILLKKAATLEQAGEIERSLAVLGEARPLVDAGGEARDRMGVRFNTLVDLWHLGRHSEAEELLPELRQLVSDLGNEQDLTRLRWLAARLAAGLGRREEALRGLLAAQREFRESGKAYDAALVSLDLALLYLEEGRTREAAALAGETAWIFSARDVHREVLCALRLLAEAAERQTLTADLVQQLRDELEHPRHDRRGVQALRRRARSRWRKERERAPRPG
jgi:transcriptional regulator with XRE-family HTH domain/tetratricopeptide (TPR) repeat protein